MTNRRTQDFDIFDYVPFLMIIGFSLVLVVGPLIAIGRVVTTQQVIKQECKTNYRLCQIKNQTVTIK